MPFAREVSGSEKSVAPDHEVHNHTTEPSTSRFATNGYEFFNVNESAFIEAAVDTLIPADTVGPGAAEVGVATYIDRQMVGGYGKGDRMYMEGPYAEGTPQQGYQLAMTPSELIARNVSDQVISANFMVAHVIMK